MLTYSDAHAFVSAGLTAKGYGVGVGPVMPVFHPGPPALVKLHTKSPHSMCFLTVGNGIGLTREGLYDRPFIVTRVIGRQNDYGYAETLAYDIDAMMLAVENGTVGTSRTLYITRNAPPQLVDFDAADRYHFQTTYIAEAKR